MSNLHSYDELTINASQIFPIYFVYDFR